MLSYTNVIVVSRGSQLRMYINNIYTIIRCTVNCPLNIQVLRNITVFVQTRIHKIFILYHTRYHVRRVFVFQMGRITGPAVRTVACPDAVWSGVVVNPSTTRCACCPILSPYWPASTSSEVRNRLLALP